MAKRWYVVHTYSGFENKVKQNIEHCVAMEGFKDLFFQVIIPAESAIEIKDGKKRKITRNLMPGYILVEMESNEDLFNLIRHITGVSGFVGSGENAIPLTEDEIQNILQLVEHKKEKPKPEIKYHIGEQVKVIEGPFVNFQGSIDVIDEEKGKIKVMVSIFGRPTPVELDVLQVESI